MFPRQLVYLSTRQLNLFIYLHHAAILLAHDVQPFLQALYSVAVQVLYSCRHFVAVCSNRTDAKLNSCCANACVAIKRRSKERFFLIVIRIYNVLVC